MRRHLFATTVMVMLLVLTTGCRKPIGQGADGRTESQGDSAATPKDGLPPPPTTDGTTPPPRIRTNSTRSRFNLKLNSEHMLKQLGLGYKTEAIIGKVTGPQQLRNLPLRDAFGKPFVIVYNVDLNRVANPSQYSLAWEEDVDSSGKRYVLMADCTTVKYVTDDELKEIPRVK